jgi:thioredoxin 1
MSVEVTDSTFHEEVEKSSIPVLVDFWASWCGPCKMIAPFLEELAVSYSDRIKICKVDVDKNPKLAEKFQITSIPTLLVVKDGKVVRQQIGALPKQGIEKLFLDQI